VVGYFRTRQAADGRWRTTVAPLIAIVGLSIAVLLIVGNYPILTGTHNPVINVLPVTIPVVMAAGAGFALWLRRERPRWYAGLAEVRLRENSQRRARPVARYDGNYCIVGAGPAGLLTARAMRL